MEWCILQNLLSCLCGLYCLSAFFLSRKEEQQHLFRKKKKSKLCFFLSYYFYCLRFLLDYNVALWFWDGKNNSPLSFKHKNVIVCYCCQQWAKEVNGSQIWQTAISPPAQYIKQYTFHCYCWAYDFDWVLGK